VTLASLPQALIESAPATASAAYVRIFIVCVPLGVEEASLEQMPALGATIDRKDLRATTRNAADNLAMQACPDLGCKFVLHPTVEEVGVPGEHRSAR